MEQKLEGHCPFSFKVGGALAHAAALLPTPLFIGGKFYCPYAISDGSWCCFQIREKCLQFSSHSLLCT